MDALWSCIESTDIHALVSFQWFWRNWNVLKLFQCYIGSSLARVRPPIYALGRLLARGSIYRTRLLNWAAPTHSSCLATTGVHHNSTDATDVFLLWVALTNCKQIACNFVLKQVISSLAFAGEAAASLPKDWSFSWQTTTRCQWREAAWSAKEACVSFSWCHGEQTPRWSSAVWWVLQFKAFNFCVLSNGEIYSKWKRATKANTGIRSYWIVNLAIVALGGLHFSDI